jgi:hypothetical protein
MPASDGAVKQIQNPPRMPNYVVHEVMQRILYLPILKPELQVTHNMEGATIYSVDCLPTGDFRDKPLV